MRSVMRVLPLTACLAALAGCGWMLKNNTANQTAAVTTNTSGGTGGGAPVGMPTFPPPAPVAVTVKPRPGMWEWTAHGDVLQVSGASDDQVAALRNQLNSTPPRRQCMTQAQADEDVASGMARGLASSSACRFDNLTNVGGRLSGHMNCGGAGSNAAGTGDLTGSITPEAVLISFSFDMRNPADASHSVRIRMSMNGARVGDCPMGGSGGGSMFPGPFPQPQPQGPTDGQGGK